MGFTDNFGDPYRFRTRENIVDEANLDDAL